MKKKEKGRYGYINYYKKTKLLITLLLAVMIAFVIITMLLMYGDTNRVMVVFAILLVLPFAKFLIAYIMCIKFSSMPEDMHKRIFEKTKTDAGEEMTGLLYDVVITQYEGMHFFESVCVKNGKVCALVLDKKYPENKSEYEKCMQAALANSKYKYLIHIYTDVDAYLKKVCSLSTPNDNTRIIDRHMREQLLTYCV
ncbi:MAG: hypothetical protein ACI4L2_06790 [Wujia sp.]